MATAKQATTMEIHAALATWDRAVEMCQRPWTVEFSKNSLIVVDAMMHLFYFGTLVTWAMLSQRAELKLKGRFTGKAET